MNNRYFLFFLLVFCWAQTNAQETFPRNDVLDERVGAYAFTNAQIVVDPQTTVEGGTMLIRDGRIEGVGTNVRVPKGYTVIDLDGKYIYPSLIDIYTNYGLPEIKRERRGRGFGGPEQINSNKPGAYNANQAIKSEYQASEEFTVDDKTAESLRNMGFGSVLTFKADGISRGTSAFVTLGNDRPNEVMLNSQTAAHYSFNKGTSTQNYPSSVMGRISLLRQTYMDADWYAKQEVKPFTDKSLDAWNATQNLPQIFEATSWLSLTRADKVGDEFGVQYIIKSAGDEYQRIEELKATGASLIVPLTFPDAFDVEDPFDAERVSLKDMKHWEMAPANLAALEKNEIPFAITAHGLKGGKKFWGNLRKAIKHGLNESTALAALTTKAAEMVNMEDQVGSLTSGKLANFIITSDNLFKEKTVIHENWVQGHRYHMKDLETQDFAGNYELKVDDQSYSLVVDGDAGSHKAHIAVNDTTEIKVELKLSGELATLSFVPGKSKETVRLSGWWDEGGWKGKGQLVDGTWVDWQASSRTEKIAESSDTNKKRPDRSNTDTKIGEIIYPFVAFGATEKAKQENILIKNATVWTMEDDGILEGTDVLIEEGKIKRIGKNLNARGARVIDGTGKYLTPGIIDEHSHIAASSINEGVTNSSLVRIGDNLDSEDIGIYRALAGGVTAVQVLHGSANPIGGQSGLIKLRWGAAPEELKIDGADKFIKFALGENVKRSRSESSIRYPQTRMGVEQVYVDAFTNAREYEKSWKAYNQLSASQKVATPAPRRDLTNEAILEILNGEMFITCHSYVQSEINMLMKVAESFDFSVNTFTHILEGYKVADKMKAHGVGASTFSDWWNYKWEVRYAIPYNAAIMHREGVVTALNSDSGELMRRLNSETAKAVKYGGLDELDAFKMVTVNPAKLLHLDDRMGSIKVGKDGDVVLWSDHPMSIYAKAEKTIVDGTVYFDIEKDLALRAYIQKERARLTQKMKDAKKSGMPTRKGSSSYKMEMHCEDMLGEATEHFFEHKH